MPNPIPQCLPATNITETAATLHGQVSGAAAGDTYQLIWGTAPSPFQHTLNAGTATGAPVDSFSVAIPELLIPGTLYYFKVLVITATSQYTNPACSFTTLPEPPVLEVADCGHGHTPGETFTDVPAHNGNQPGGGTIRKYYPAGVNDGWQPLGP